MEKLQAESGQEISAFREAIEAAKHKYVGEIARLAEASKKGKQQMEAKMLMLKEHTEAALQKNQEIEGVNDGLRRELEGVGS